MVRLRSIRKSHKNKHTSKFQWNDPYASSCTQQSPVILLESSYPYLTELCHSKIRLSCCSCLKNIKAKDFMSSRVTFIRIFSNLQNDQLINKCLPNNSIVSSHLYTTVINPHIVSETILVTCHSKSLPSFPETIFWQHFLRISQSTNQEKL